MNQRFQRLASGDVASNIVEDRSARVFVSSTFNDMHQERDILVKTVFPDLRDRFRSRGVEVFEVDLRWGVTEEQSERGETLPILLSEIDRCRPFFIALLGERYGWVPPSEAIDADLRAAYPSIADCNGRSITELEIIHGVLSDPNAAAQALVFERDPTWAHSQTPNHDYLEPDPVARARLADLKARIRASGVRFVPYAAPEELAPAALSALGEILERRYPEAASPDAVVQDLRLHAAYARERRALYVGGERYLSRLDDWARDPAAAPMLVAGASGAGKSALIANWIEARRTERPEDFIFEHYLGASPDSADPIRLMQRLCRHLDRSGGVEAEPPPGDAGLIALSDALQDRLSAANQRLESADGIALLALDGLDKLSTGHDLRWLPRRLPPRIKLLASSLDSLARDAAIERGWNELAVEALDDEDRRALLSGALSRWGRDLSDRHSNAILSHPLAGAPLFLKTVLEELRYSATHDRLNERLSYYLHANDMPNLFDRLLERLEHDSGGRPGVERAASSIWASRAGLEESEILEITELAPIEWAAIRRGFGGSVRDQLGRLTFSHDYLRDAVATRYLATEDTVRHAHLDIAYHFSIRAADHRQLEELPFQYRAAREWNKLESLLVDLDRFELTRKRGDAELLWYWVALHEQDRNVEACLCAALAARCGEPECWTEADLTLSQEIIEFLDYAGAAGPDYQRLGAQRASASQRLLGEEHPTTLKALGDFAVMLYAQGDLEQAETITEQVLALESRVLGADDLSTVVSMSNLAQILRDRGDYKRCQHLMQEVIAIETQQLGAEHPATLTSRLNFAGGLSDLGDLDAAAAEMESILEIAMRVLGRRHADTLKIMINLATVCYHRNDIARARLLCEDSVAAQMELFGPEHPATLTAASNLAQVLSADGEHDKALELMEFVLEMRRAVLGPEHRATLVSASNLGFELHRHGDYEAALLRDSEVLEARLRNLGAEHPETLVSRANMAANLRKLNHRAAAREQEMLVYETRQRLYGPDDEDTRHSLRDLIEDAEALGDNVGALVLRGHLQESDERVFGPEDPRLVSNLSVLADGLHNAGDYAAAARRYEQLAALCEQINGREHLNTFRSLGGLGAALFLLGEFARAEHAQLRALEIGQRILAPGSEELGVAEHNLAATRQAQNGG